MNITRTTLCNSVVAFAVTCAGAISAQTATLLDGTVLTRNEPLQPFATEGPMWNLLPQSQQIEVTGKRLTIPLTLNGVEFFIFGSSVLGQDGEAATGIGAANFSRLLDTNAIGADRDILPIGGNLGPRRLGPARSIFSTSEGRRIPLVVEGAPLRDATAQGAIEANYFAMVQAAHAAHAAALPADFLSRAGIRGPLPEDMLYPVTAGGTLKSAGHTYSDAAGNQFLVPDIEAVIELSENVSQGVVSSAARGSGMTPDSFVIGELLVIFNQDPRFGADTFGLGEAPISREVFFEQVIPGDSVVDTIGHMVGEHVMFVQEVLTELIDPVGPIFITADRFDFRDGRNELRFRGTVDKPAGITLVAILGGVEAVIPLAIDPLTGAATYDVRFRDVPGLITANVTDIVLEARDANGVVQGSATFLRSEVE